MIYNYYNMFPSFGGVFVPPNGVPNNTAFAGYQAASSFVTGSTLGLVGISYPSANNSRNAALELTKGNTITCTFVGERGFEGGPQPNEVRVLTVDSVNANPPRGQTTSTGEIIWIFVDENPGIHGYGSIKIIEFPTAIVRIPSGLKPNTIYNY